MKKAIVLLVALVMLHHARCQEELSNKLDEVIRIYGKYNKFNGTVLVAQHGKILLEKGYGLKNVVAAVPNDPGTIFQIGSLTKEFTAAIILQLAHEKKLSLTDPVTKYFIDFPHADSITIYNLLTHTSGIFNYSDIYDFWDRSGKPTNEQSVLDTLKGKPLLFSVGQQYSYSNSNYMLLAYIIQKVTHKSYETVVRERIFNPLDMSQSGFDFTHLNSPDKATGYWEFSAVKYREGPVSDSSEFIGAGSMYSSATDLYKWHRALQEGKILSKEQQKLAYKPFKGKYAFGWETDSVYGKHTVGHGGRLFGFECRMIRIPEDDVFIILLNNNSDAPHLHAIGEKMIAILYQKPYDLPEEPVSLTDEQLKTYTGAYADGEHTFEIKAISGHLFALLPKDKALELLPLKNNRFSFMEHEGEAGIFTVLINAGGIIEGMNTVNPRGGNVTIKKIH